MTDRISYTPAEAAEATGINLKVIQAAYLSGDLLAHYVSPQRPVILADDLRAWVAARPTERATA